MLVLSRLENQKVIFPNLGITIEVVKIKGKNIKLGIDAPSSIKILREELADQQTKVDQKNAFDHLSGKIDSLGSDQRHEVKNHLNTASLSIHVAQKMLVRDNLLEVDKSLRLAFQALNSLNALLGETQEETKLTSPMSPAVGVGDQIAATGKQGNPGKSRTALIVEDCDNERELLAGVLRMSGFQVVAVANGLAAIEYLENNCQPDVVLMDMHMPMMDGPEAVTKIRSELGNESLPIFAVTGMTQAESKLPIGGRGVTGWFSKPVDPNHLVRHVLGEIALSVN